MGTCPAVGVKQKDTLPGEGVIWNPVLTLLNSKELSPILVSTQANIQGKFPGLSLTTATQPVASETEEGSVTSNLKTLAPTTVDPVIVGVTDTEKI